MKLYKCDSCGRITEEKYGKDLFMEGGWTMEFFDKEGNPIKIDLDSAAASSKEKVDKIKHYCPFCFYPLY